MRLGEFTDRTLLMSQIFSDFATHKRFGLLSIFGFFKTQTFSGFKPDTPTDSVIDHKRRDFYIS